ncbi:MAG: ABC transporter substrate-binding protein [Chthonomonadales bacterium]|nr:ABC transporter substrate-binding protein [Chthonomonadales bacterium]
MRTPGGLTRRGDREAGLRTDAARGLYALACAALCLAIAVGCARGGAGAPPRVRLTIWSMWTGQEERNFRAVLDMYERTHPGVEVRNLGAVRDDTKTVRAIVAGVPPDVFTLADPLYLGPLAANAAVYSLDERFRRAGLRESDFIPASLSQCRSSGRLYAMPYLIDCYALMWNKDLFRQAGLDPERPPATLSELRDYALRLTRQSDGNLTRLGLQPLGDVYLLNQVFGGRLFDPRTNRVTPDDPPNVRALEWYVDLVNAMGGYQEVNGFAAGFGQAQGTNNPFFVGKVAMMVNGEWNPYWCSRYAPKLNYGVAPMPHLEGRAGGAPATWLGGNMLCIPKGSKHPDAAWDLLVWMQSTQAQIAFAQAMNNVPNIRACLGSSALREGADYRRKFASFLDLADSPNGGHFPALPVGYLYNNELSNARDLALAGVKSPAQALRDVRLRVQRDLDRYAH